MVTLINVYTVPADQEAAFLRGWQYTSEMYARATGFVEAYLHRNLGEGSDSFQFVSITYWASTGDFQRVRQVYAPGEEQLAGVRGYPAFFEAVRAVRHRSQRPIGVAAG